MPQAIQRPRKCWVVFREKINIEREISKNKTKQKNKFFVVLKHVTSVRINKNS